MGGVIVARAFLLVVLIGISGSISSYASDFGLAYGLGEYANSDQTKIIKIHVKQHINDKAYVKGLLLDRESDEEMMTKDEAFFGIGLQSSRPNSHMQIDLLLSDDTWRINPLAESDLSDKVSLRVGVMHRDLYEGKMSTTMLHGGMLYRINSHWTSSAEYWSGNLTKRNVNDYLLFGLSKNY